MAVSKLKQLKQSAKRAPLSFAVKVCIAIVLGLSFAVIWSTFSPTSTEEEVSIKRNSFGDISDSESENTIPKHKEKEKDKGKDKRIQKPHSKDATIEVPKTNGETVKKNETDVERENEKEEREKEEGEEEQGQIDEKAISEETQNPNENESENQNQNQNSNENSNENEEEGEEISDEEEEAMKIKSQIKIKKPLFDPSAQYHFKQCGTKSGTSYVPCLDFENDGSKRHTERTCPKTGTMCLVPAPKDYKEPLPWPERQNKIWYNNVAHPRLNSYIKSHSWLKISGDYLTFPKEKSLFKAGAPHYLDSIEEMVPDLEFGKNIRTVLDIGTVSSELSIALTQKNVLTLSLGLVNDQINLGQLVLERGIPVILQSLGSRRLDFPSGVFDAIHCGECDIAWHHNGGKLLLEMNRILRPGGYFITSDKHGDIETEKGMRKLLDSICWTVLAHSVDEESEVGIRVYQRPASNDIFEIRPSKNPPFCKENEDPDYAWYTPIQTCLHKIPVAIEERGSDWPTEWPSRLEIFPDWLADSKEKLNSDLHHWRSVVRKSYLNGLGVDWSTVRNVLDMKSIYGGFAAALASQNVWVMSVVPVHAPNTLPIIYERGLIGVYHDWCEPFSTYPRSYDLLHADHLFSRLKNRCKQPVGIVVEMDRILRPGGWAIVRDKLEILNPLETILKSLNWEIRMSYGKDKEGIICAQKMISRP
ncbi:hypothetical protein LUZ60_010389 [Juncus effusus]|nr:hypothetical protein LUZ60_010389 [Juncus effusus]